MTIQVSTIIRADLSLVWSLWNSPEHIKNWNAASSDWHTTASEVNLTIGGKFTARMEARDGSAGFDFSGTYTNIVEQKLIEYDLDDGRKVTISFTESVAGVIVSEAFDPELTHSIEQQQLGWQAILTNFSQYAEQQSAQQNQSS